MTRSPVDQFQIQGQFWNPWEKIFDWYFIVCTRTAAIWRKNELLKKMVLEKFITLSPVDQFQIRGQFWNPWENIFYWYFIVCTRMAAIWRKNEHLKKMMLEKFITRSLVDQFQIRGQFWNPWEKGFDWYLIICTRSAAIWRKNERLKKMVLEKFIILSQWTNFKSEGSFGILGKKSLIDIL